MNGPPKHYPKNLDKQFASDPFDGRFVVGGSLDRHHTALGLMIEVYQWYQTHQDECGPAFKPVLASLRDLIKREAPDTLAELEAHGT